MTKSNRITKNETSFGRSKRRPTVINTMLVIFIGLFSFVIEDANPFWWVYSKLILVLGTIFPIEYFPMFLQGILKFSPIYVVSYGPAKLFVDFS